MARSFFVTGTDTGVGKTRVAQALIAAAAESRQRVAGMKPVASGCRATAGGLRSDDAEALMRAANVPAAYSDVNPYAFAPAVSPHIAAPDVGGEISLEQILQCHARLAARADYVVVEGAGGWLTPIDARRTMADVAAALAAPVVLVVGMRLGCINHALLTQAEIARCGLACAGWIANRIDPAMQRFEDNVASLKQRLRAPLLAVMPHALETPSALARQLARALDIPE